MKQYQTPYLGEKSRSIAPSILDMIIRQYVDLQDIRVEHIQ